MARGWVRAAVCALAVGCTANTYKFATRNLFASLTYSDGSTTPKAAVAFQLYASLELDGVTSYLSPRDAAACYAAITSCYLETVGQQAAAPLPASADSATALGCVAAATKQSLAATFPACAQIAQGEDGDLLAYSVTRMAATTEAFARQSATKKTTYEAVYAAAPLALGRVAKLLASTAPGTEKQADAPALALSGGSANGAYQAGFMFELLWARERALKDLKSTLADLDAASHFSAIVGTSVGALIAQLLDIYYGDGSKLTKSQQAAVDACLHYEPKPQLAWSGQASSSCFGHVDAKSKALMWPTDTFPGIDVAKLDASRKLQGCALENLYRYFTDSEDEQLMCVEPGPITAVEGFLDEARPGLVRFDVMSRDIIDFVLRDFADVTLANDVTRVVVSVDNQTNQTLGLDERACAGLPSLPGQPGHVALPGGREYCLGSGAMASMMLPFFARPVRHVYAGYADAGECGAWLDGGLRSGFPALRALHMTRPSVRAAASQSALLRVLAVDTGRLDGQPSGRLTDIAGVALNSIGQLASQNDVYEAVMAQEAATLRERTMAAMKKCHASSPPNDCHASPTARRATAMSTITPYAQPDLSPDDSLVMPIFVPADIPDAIVAAAEYSFDRYVMRGLFTWGRFVAMQRILGQLPDGASQPKGRWLLDQLGWPQSLKDKTVAYVQVDQDASQDPHDATLYPWFRGFAMPTECDDFHAQRLADGNARIVGQVPDCGEVTDTSGSTPEYFVCPAGATEPRKR